MRVAFGVEFERVNPFVETETNGLKIERYVRLRATSRTNRNDRMCKWVGMWLKRRGRVTGSKNYLGEGGEQTKRSAVDFGLIIFVL